MSNRRLLIEVRNAIASQGLYRNVHPKSIQFSKTWMKNQALYSMVSTQQALETAYGNGPRVRVLGFIVRCSRSFIRGLQ